MAKFGRNYTLEVQTRSGNTLVITLPFTVEFDISRKTLAGAGNATIRVYNLAEDTRSQIRFNSYDMGTHRSIVFKAGYGDNQAVVFSGNISQAWSVREGVDFITEIQCFDGGFGYANGVTSMAFPAGVTLNSVVRTIAATIPHTTPGVYGAYPGTLSRGNTYNGNTAEILTDLTGGGFFIDNGKTYALGTNEFIGKLGAITLIDSASGLLGTPILEVSIVRFDMIFEPRLAPGSPIILKSTSAPAFNNTYKTTGVKHRGMISDAVCGDAITSGEFFYAPSLMGVF